MLRETTLKGKCGSLDIKCKKKTGCTYWHPVSEVGGVAKRLQQ